MQVILSFDSFFLFGPSRESFHSLSGLLMSKSTTSAAYQTGVLFFFVDHFSSFSKIGPSSFGRHNYTHQVQQTFGNYRCLQFATRIGVAEKHSNSLWIPQKKYFVSCRIRTESKDLRIRGHRAVVVEFLHASCRLQIEDKKSFSRDVVFAESSTKLPGYDQLDGGMARTAPICTIFGHSLLTWAGKEAVCSLKASTCTDVCINSF